VLTSNEAPNAACVPLATVINRDAVLRARQSGARWSDSLGPRTCCRADVSVLVAKTEDTSKDVQRWSGRELRWHGGRGGSQLRRCPKRRVGAAGSGSSAGADGTSGWRARGPQARSRGRGERAGRRGLDGGATAGGAGESAAALSGAGSGTAAARVTTATGMMTSAAVAAGPAGPGGSRSAPADASSYAANSCSAAPGVRALEPTGARGLLVAAVAVHGRRTRLRVR
jgi:hypothetical protein